MSPDGVIEPVDVSGHRVLGLAAGPPGDRPDQFGLDGLEERLDDRYAPPEARSRRWDNLGIMYDNGWGVPKDYPERARAAAAKRYPAAAQKASARP